MLFRLFFGFVWCQVGFAQIAMARRNHGLLWVCWPTLVGELLWIFDIFTRSWYEDIRRYCLKGRRWCFSLPLGGKRLKSIEIISQTASGLFFSQCLDRWPQAAAYENLSAELLAANLTVPRHALSELLGLNVGWNETIPGDGSTSMIWGVP